MSISETLKKCEIRLKLTVKTPEDVIIVNFDCYFTHLLFASKQPIFLERSLK